jgi:hypothetical protein
MSSLLRLLLISRETFAMHDRAAGDRCCLSRVAPNFTIRLVDARR